MHVFDDLMEKALVSGNYSVVLGWLPEISSEEMKRLESAASKGKTLGFLVAKAATATANAIAVFFILRLVIIQVRHLALSLIICPWLNYC